MVTGDGWLWLVGGESQGEGAAEYCEEEEGAGEAETWTVGDGETVITFSLKILISYRITLRESLHSQI